MTILEILFPEEIDGVETTMNHENFFLDAECSDWNSENSTSMLLKKKSSYEFRRKENTGNLLMKRFEDILFIEKSSSNLPEQELTTNSMKLNDQIVSKHTRAKR